MLQSVLSLTQEQLSVLIHTVSCHAGQSSVLRPSVQMHALQRAKNTLLVFRNTE